MTKEEKEDLYKEKLFSLFLVSFGGHKSTMDWLANYFRYHYDEKEGLSHFFFLEYLLLDPLTRKDGFKKAIVFCPFLERMIKEQQFLPK
ncbi:MAG TPA: hypothetical protein ACFYD6_12975 [Candidatus Brocadiia bacterium]|nr:hypothetical protein [Candidatus Brocadiales bacterium]